MSPSNAGAGLTTCAASASLANPFSGLFNAPAVIVLKAAATAATPPKGN